MPTPPQTMLITDLLAERQMTDDARAKALAELPGIDTPTASRWINRLFTLPKIQNAAVPSNAPGTPAGHYAVEYDGTLRFYVVDRPTEGRWAGFTFLSVKASDEKHAIRNRETKAAILKAIDADPLAAKKRYGQEIGSCGECNRTLTDEISRAMGIGPECCKKLGIERPKVLTAAEVSENIAAEDARHDAAMQQMERDEDERVAAFKARRDQETVQLELDQQALDQISESAVKRVEKAVAGGNPLTLITDGIGEDESLSGKEQAVLVTYARNLARTRHERSRR